MVERYHSQVQQGSLPNAYMRNYVDGAATGVQVAGAIQQGGEEIRKYAMVQQRRQDEWDAARVMEAQTEYNRVMSDHMDNPDTGITNTRKLGAARGVTDEVDKYGDEMAGKIADTLDNDAQRQAFLRVAQRAKIPYWKQGSEFEARQVKTYRDQVFKTTLDQGGMSVQRAPLDNVAFAAAAEQGANAIRSQFYGADPSVINAAIEEYTSGLEQQRIAIVASEDPILAGQMIEDSQYLTPEAASKLKSSIAPQVELLETQEFVDGFVQEYGPDREQEGIAKIRETSSGKDEEKKVSAYKARINEMKVDRGNADAAQAKIQRDNYNRLFSEYIANDKYPPAEMTMKMLQNGELSPTQWKQLQEVKASMATRTDAEKAVRSRSGAGDMTPAQFESAVMREMGTTDEEHRRIFNDTLQGVQKGSITDADIDYLKAMGKLSTNDVAKLKSTGKTLDAAQKDFLTQEDRSLAVSLKSLEALGVSPEIAQGVLDEFSNNVALLNSRSPDYRENVFKAKRQALLNGIDRSGGALKGYWGGKSDLGTARDQILDSTFESKAIQPYPSLPEVKPEELDLAPRAQEQTQVGNTPIAMVPNAKTVSSTYTDKRDGGKRQHNAIDVSAPMGSEIVSADFGVPLTVVRRSNGTVPGNFVTLTGTTPDGKHMEVTIMHLKDHEGPKTGTVINPGDLIGYVGNTGSTSTGPHMHLQIEVDNKRVDPEKFLASVKKQAPVAQKQAPKPQPSQSSPSASPPAAPQGRIGPTLDNAAALAAQQAPQRKPIGSYFAFPAGGKS